MAVEWKAYARLILGTACRSKMKKLLVISGLVLVLTGSAAGASGYVLYGNGNQTGFDRGLRAGYVMEYVQVKDSIIKAADNCDDTHNHKVTACGPPGVDCFRFEVSCRPDNF